MVNASMFGIEALGDSLRREVSPWGIDVVLVEPGSIATEIWNRAVDQREEQMSTMPADVPEKGRHLRSAGRPACA